MYVFGDLARVDLREPDELGQLLGEPHGTATVGGGAGIANLDCMVIGHKSSWCNIQQ